MLTQWLKRLLGRPDASPGDAQAQARSPSGEDIELAMEAWQDGWDGWVQGQPAGVSGTEDVQISQYKVS